tara:strand:- start:6 stop:467 length:462 start_codon:yes stop_codon:yes gene_type:complete
MANKYFRGFNNLFKFGKSTGEDTGKVINTIVGVKPAKNLKKRFDTKQDINKSIDKQAGPNVSNEAKSKIKRDAGKKVSKIYDKYEKSLEKKANGGRIGRRFGSPNPKKTNVQKIKETFAPKKKNLSPKQMKIAKLAGNPNKIDGADFKKLRNR